MSHHSDDFEELSCTESYDSFDFMEDLAPLPAPRAPPRAPPRRSPPSRAGDDHVRFAPSSRAAPMATGRKEGGPPSFNGNGRTGTLIVVDDGVGRGRTPRREETNGAAEHVHRDRPAAPHPPHAPIATTTAMASSSPPTGQVAAVESSDSDPAASPAPPLPAGYPPPPAQPPRMRAVSGNAILFGRVVGPVLPVTIPARPVQRRPPLPAHWQKAPTVAMVKAQNTAGAGGPHPVRLTHSASGGSGGSFQPPPPPTKAAEKESALLQRETAGAEDGASVAAPTAKRVTATPAATKQSTPPPPPRHPPRRSQAKTSSPLTDTTNEVTAPAQYTVEVSLASRAPPPEVDAAATGDCLYLDQPHGLLKQVMAKSPDDWSAFPGGWGHSQRYGSDAAKGEDEEEEEKVGDDETKGYRHQHYPRRFEGADCSPSPLAQVSFGVENEDTAHAVTAEGERHHDVLPHGVDDDNDGDGDDHRIQHVSALAYASSSSAPPPLRAEGKEAAAVSVSPLHSGPLYCRATAPPSEHTTPHSSTAPGENSLRTSSTFSHEEEEDGDERDSGDVESGHTGTAERESVSDAARDRRDLPGAAALASAGDEGDAAAAAAAVAASGSHDGNAEQGTPMLHSDPLPNQRCEGLVEAGGARDVEVIAAETPAPTVRTADGFLRVNFSDSDSEYGAGDSTSSSFAVISVEEANSPSPPHGTNGEEDASACRDERAQQQQRQQQCTRLPPSGDAGSTTTAAMSAVQPRQHDDGVPHAGRSQWTASPVATRSELQPPISTHCWARPFSSSTLSHRDDAKVKGENNGGCSASLREQYEALPPLPLAQRVTLLLLVLLPVNLVSLDMLALAVIRAILVHTAGPCEDGGVGMTLHAATWQRTSDSVVCRRRGADPMKSIPSLASIVVWLIIPNGLVFRLWYQLHTQYAWSWSALCKVWKDLEDVTPYVLFAWAVSLQAISLMVSVPGAAVNWWKGGGGRLPPAEAVP